MRALAPAPSARLHYLVGSFLAWWGWRQGAAQAFRDGLRCDPSFFDAHLRLGEALGRSGCWIEASVAFRAAARLRPCSVDAQGNLVHALGRAGLWEGAAAAVQRLIRLRPHQAELHLLLARVMHKLHRPQEAIRSLRSAARLDPLPKGVTCPLGEALLGPDRWNTVLRHHAAARALAGFDRPETQPRTKRLVRALRRWRPRRPTASQWARSSPAARIARETSSFRMNQARRAPSGGSPRSAA